MTSHKSFDADILGINLLSDNCSFFVEKKGGSPYINRFLQPDTLIPGVDSPQAWNRFSYTVNNPIRFNDPTGHFCSDPEDPTPSCDGSGGSGSGSSGGSSGGSDGDSSGNHDDDLEEDLETGGDVCDSDEICISFDTTNICYFINCALGATAAGMFGTAADFGAFIINIPFAITADLALLATWLGVPLGPLGYGAVLTAYKLVGAPLSNISGFTGLGFWALQGMLTGESHVGITVTLDSQWQLKESSLSASIAQDTVFSALNDTLALSLWEPNVATIWSGVGVVYDIGRNPLAPSFSSADPILPTVIQPNFNLTYSWQSNSLNSGFSFFP